MVCCGTFWSGQLACAGAIGHARVFLGRLWMRLMHAIYINKTGMNKLRIIWFKIINIFLYILAFWQHLVLNWRAGKSTSSATHIMYRHQCSCKFLVFAQYYRSTIKSLTGTYSYHELKSQPILNAPVRPDIICFGAMLSLFTEPLIRTPVGRKRLIT